MDKLKVLTKSVSTEIKENMAPYKWEYLFGVIFVGIILFSEMYEDFFATYRNGLNFWYALTEGHPFSFYSYAKAIHGATHNRGIGAGAAYDFTIYAVFAIWNLPAWIYEKISGILRKAVSCVCCGVKQCWLRWQLQARQVLRKYMNSSLGTGKDQRRSYMCICFRGF